MKLGLMVILIFLSGCAHTIAEPPINQQKLLEVKNIFASPHQIEKNKKTKLKPHKISQSANSLTDGFITFLYDSEKQPIIQTTPFQATVIRLEPSEKFTNISSGDPSRWSYAVAISDKEENAQQNILVKPSLPNINTNLVITTDKRLYNLRLVSAQTESFTRSVSFVYPETLAKADVSIEETHHCSKRPTLHFDYCITCPQVFAKLPDWKPIRVFDDSTHTYIQFPETISHRDLPALFVIQNGQKTCINYRFKSPYMMLDNVFNEALLVSGVGQSQQTVMITHRDQ